MKNIKEYIESGVIEMYVMGLGTEEDNREIERLSLDYPEIKSEIDKITDALLESSNRDPKRLNLSSNVKPFIMAIIDYTERLKNGEQISFPPALNENSKTTDYSTWINRKDMICDASSENIYAKIIGSIPGVMTAIVWLKEGSPHEVHDNEYEKFLILEGSCNIVTKDEVFPLVPGNYFQIPLHVGHTVEVTSKIPCKLILQRMAAWWGLKIYLA